MNVWGYMVCERVRTDLVKGENMQEVGEERGTGQSWPWNMCLGLQTQALEKNSTRDALLAQGTPQILLSTGPGAGCFEEIIITTA